MSWSPSPWQTSGRSRQATQNLEPVSLKAPIECAPAQPQGFGCLAGIALKSTHGFSDQELLHFLEAHVFQTPFLRVPHLMQAKIGQCDVRSGRHQDGPLHDMTQLTNIAGPGVRQQRLDGGFGNATHVPAVSLAVLTEEMTGQYRNVFRAFPERGQMDLDRV
jgi:hypothetical protein